MSKCNKCNKCCNTPCTCKVKTCNPNTYQGPSILCAGIEQGDSYDTTLRNLAEYYCGLQESVDQFNNLYTEEWQQSLQGADGEDGTDGISGRGVAVFFQDTEPDQSDFDSQYSNVEGFGVNGVTGSDTFKPGDLWVNENIV